MKKTYQDPKLQVEFFAIQDIITTSSEEIEATTGNMGGGENPSPMVPVTD